jgi:hypothetical protein
MCPYFMFLWVIRANRPTFRLIKVREGNPGFERQGKEILVFLLKFSIRRLRSSHKNSNNASHVWLGIRFFTCRSTRISAIGTIFEVSRSLLFSVR